MSRKYKVSVCMATYNGEKYIQEQLESILIQLSDNDEVIISDDRSTDNTLEVIRNIKDNRIKIITHEKCYNRFRGSYRNIYYVYKNFENAMRYASGDVIFLSDQDDIWLPNRVQKSLSEIDKGSQCILLNNTVINDQREVLIPSYFKWSKPSRSWIRFILRCFYQGASMAFTRDIKDMSLNFPNVFPISHDHWIACVAWTHGKNISFIDEPYLLYRRHGNNVSPSGEKSKNSLYFKISYRFNLFFQYLNSFRR